MLHHSESVFHIYLHEMIYELNQLDENDRKFVLKQAVGRIFEDINFDLYHNSISANLEVVLVK